MTWMWCSGHTTPDTPLAEGQVGQVMPSDFGTGRDFDISEWDRLLSQLDRLPRSIGCVHLNPAGLTNQILFPLTGLAQPIVLDMTLSLLVVGRSQCFIPTAGILDLVLWAKQLLGLRIWLGQLRPFR